MDSEVSRQAAIVYYRKDASWLAHSPLDPPVEDSPDSLVEVHQEVVASHQPVEGQLEEIWKKMQNIEAGDLPERLGVRSMMHGDMIVVGEYHLMNPSWPTFHRYVYKAFQCEMTGWREVRPEWLVKGDFPKSFPELMSCHEESSQEDTAS